MSEEGDHGRPSQSSVPIAQLDRIMSHIKNSTAADLSVSAPHRPLSLHLPHPSPFSPISSMIVSISSAR